MMVQGLGYPSSSGLAEAKVPLHPRWRKDSAAEAEVLDPRSWFCLNAPRAPLIYTRTHSLLVFAE